MSYLKINQSELTSTIGKITSEVSIAKENLSSISGWCDRNKKPVPDWSIEWGKYQSNHPDASYGEIDSYCSNKIQIVNEYNGNIDDIKELADDYQGKCDTANDNINELVNKIITAIETFESVTPDPIEDTPVTADTNDPGEYGTVKGYGASDTSLTDDPGGTGGGGDIGGTGASDVGTSTDGGHGGSDNTVSGVTSSETALVDKIGTGEGAAIASQIENDLGIKDDQEKKDSEEKFETKKEEDKELTEDEKKTEQDDNLKGKDEEDKGLTEDEKKTDENVDLKVKNGQDEGLNTDDAHSQTAADLVSTSENLVGNLVDEDSKLQLEDVAAMGTAGVTMLSLTNLGADDNGEGTYLSNLAMGLDDDRTLPDADLDVFEHPDHLSDGTINLSTSSRGWASYEDAAADGFSNILTEDAFLTGKANGDPNLANYENYQDYLDAMYKQNMGGMIGTGGWTSYQDVIAAGFGGSVLSENDFLIAQANGDPSVSGYASYQDYLNSMYQKYAGAQESGNGAFNLQSVDSLETQNGNTNGTSFAGGIGALAGGAAIGALAAGAVMGIGETDGDAYANGLGPYGQVTNDSKSINDFFFGTIEEIDEEEKKKQTLRERIALILGSATSLSSLITFIFANTGMIDPIWFTISTLLFALALLYFNLVIDRKSKRREELKNANGGRTFFNQNAIQPEEEKKEADWIFYGMILLSTSAFILKTYDVISWLLFIILLILFILIIIAYKILKKKFGEKNNGVPY